MHRQGSDFEPSDAAQYRACTDLIGSVHRLTRYRRNGRWEVNVAHVPSIPDASTTAHATAGDSAEADSEIRLRLRRLQLETYVRYVREGRCTVVELRTICGIWFRNLGVRELARREGVSPAAISSRIERLRAKAPEFYTGWYVLNINRRNRRRP